MFYILSQEGRGQNTPLMYCCVYFLCMTCLYLSSVYAEAKKSKNLIWTTVCCKHTRYGRSLEDVFTSNNTLWTTTQPAQCHLSFTQEHRQEPRQLNVSLVWPTQTSRRFSFYDRYIILVRHHSRVVPESQQTARLDFDATTSTLLRRLNIHTFDFRSFTAMNDCGFYPEEGVQYCTYTHVCVFYVYIQMCTDRLRVLHLDSRELSVCRRRRATGAEEITYSMYNNIHNIHKPPGDLDKDTKLFWHFSLHKTH